MLQVFIRDSVECHTDVCSVQTIIAMVEVLGIDVIAAGVETEAQCKFLELCGCRAYQGYLFSKPIPLDVFMQFLSNRANIK